MIPLKYAALLALVIQTTSAVILTRYSKLFAPEGMPKYFSTSLVVSAEFTKFVASLALVFFVDLGQKDESVGDARSLSVRVEQFKDLLWRENFANPSATLKLAVPAALYTLQNNLIYVALSNLEPTTFQVGYQMKVITTAVLSVIILSRSLSWTKWSAIFLLAVGIILTQIEGGGKDKAANDEDQNFSLGLLSVVICGCSSALAGVYFEKILKGTPTSVWVRNAQLAFFSVVFGMMGCIGVDGIFLQFFQGYYSMVWAIIFVQAIGGLIVAVVVKYADNILKGFATAISIVVCGIASGLLFGFSPTALFYLGSIIVIIATMLYSVPDAKPAPSPAAAGATGATVDGTKTDSPNNNISADGNGGGDGTSAIASSGDNSGNRVSPGSSLNNNDFSASPVMPVTADTHGLYRSSGGSVGASSMNIGSKVSLSDPNSYLNDPNSNRRTHRGRLSNFSSSSGGGTNSAIVIDDINSKARTD